MSVLNQINRIKLNISDSLDTIAAYGVPILTTDNSNKLAERIALIANVLEGFVKYTLQTLTDVLKQQARANIGAIDSSYHDSTKLDTISDLNTIRSGAALGATALLNLPSNAVTIDTNLTINSNKVFSKSISGNLSITWNQLMDNLTYDPKYYTVIRNSNGSFHVNNIDASVWWARIGLGSFQIPNNHKALIMVSAPSSFIQNIQYYRELPNSISIILKTSAFIYNNTLQETNISFDCSNYFLTTKEVDLFVNIFDLTQMFGAGNEPSTVEEFKSMFPLDYYEYNEGSTIEKSLIVGSNLSANIVQATDKIKINSTSITEQQLQLLLTLINN